MNIYDASVPVFVHFLGSLSAILKKAEAHCTAKKIDPSVILNARLFPDMFAFTRQVQIASDAAKGAGARLAGIAVPSFPDEEKSFEDLQARIARTVEFLAGLKRDFNNGEPERRGDERNYQNYLDRVASMKAGIARSESDIAALKRELAKLPP